MSTRLAVILALAFGFSLLAISFVAIGLIQRQIHKHKNRESLYWHRRNWK
jgi:hypothetical protein